MQQAKKLEATQHAGAAQRHSQKEGQLTCSMMLLSVRGMRLLLTCIASGSHQTLRGWITKNLAWCLFDMYSGLQYSMMISRKGPRKHLQQNVACMLSLEGAVPFRSPSCR